MVLSYLRLIHVSIGMHLCPIWNRRHTNNDMIWYSRRAGSWWLCSTDAACSFGAIRHCRPHCYVVSRCHTKFADAFRTGSRPISTRPPAVRSQSSTSFQSFVPYAVPQGSVAPALHGGSIQACFGLRSIRWWHSDIRFLCAGSSHSPWGTSIRVPYINHVATWMQANCVPV